MCVCVCVQYFLHGTVCITAANTPLRRARSHVCWQRLHHHRGLGACCEIRRACTVAVLVFEVPGQAGCQHLLEVAFWDVAAFQCLRESKHFMGSVFALSYRWLTAEHPDADSFPPVQGRRLLGGAQGGLREGGHQRGRLCGLLGLRPAVPARAHPRSEGVVPRGSAGEQRMVRQCLQDCPDPVTHSSTVHLHAVPSKRVVFRGSHDQFRHQGEFCAVRQRSLGAGRRSVS